MSTTVAGFTAFAPIPAADQPFRPALASLARAVLARLAPTDRGEVAELPPHLRADIGLPPIPERPRLRASATVGW